MNIILRNIRHTDSMGRRPVRDSVISAMTLKEADENARRVAALKAYNAGKVWNGERIEEVFDLSTTASGDDINIVQRIKAGQTTDAAICPGRGEGWTPEMIQQGNDAFWRGRNADQATVGRKHGAG